MLAFTNLKVDDIEAWGEWENNNGGIKIHWSTDDIGFGEIAIFKDKDNKIILDTECMSKAFVKAVLDRLVDMGEVR
jgi:hypothetical protein